MYSYYLGSSGGGQEVGNGLLPWSHLYFSGGEEVGNGLLPWDYLYFSNISSGGAPAFYGGMSSGGAPAFYGGVTNGEWASSSFNLFNSEDTQPGSSGSALLPSNYKCPFFVWY
ncbi:hypothetical protein PDN66_22090 [Bacillus cereus]|uniref:hypothetical protein n=1 Tax=Bacillus cereus TaxID=1396 RepID=UPI002A02ADE3|nr:hypothetical protein [Bacillus cereus]MDA2507716.1 hypothetical protein [Bacillus cereus]